MLVVNKTVLGDILWLILLFMWAILIRSFMVYTHTPVWRPFVQDYPGEPAPERQNQSGFYWSKRQWVEVASAGPYASLHLTPDTVSVGCWRVSCFG